jgi:hypothetical protein
MYAVSEQLQGCHEAAGPEIPDDGKRSVTMSFYG